MLILMSSCFVLQRIHATRLKMSRRNGGMKLRDIARVSFPLMRLIIGVKLVLVAVKCDLRDDDATKERLDKYGEKLISYEQGLAMAKTIKAVRFLGIPPHPPFSILYPSYCFIPLLFLLP